MSHFFYFTQQKAKINAILINWLAEIHRLFPRTLVCDIYRQEQDSIENSLLTEGRGIDGKLGGSGPPTHPLLLHQNFKDFLKCLEDCKNFTDYKE
jgi:hypothetical protein